MSSITRLLVPMALVLTLGPLGSCGDETTPATGADRTAPIVRLLRVAPSSDLRTCEVTGFLGSHRDVVLSAETAGRVVTRAEVEGTPVAEGAVIVVLDEREPRLLRDLARVAATEATLYPDVDAGVRQTRRLELELAQEQLDRCRVRSPLAGRLERIYVDEGEWVQVGAPVARVVDYDRLRLIIALSEEEMVRVDPARPIAFRVDAYASETFESRVVRQGRAGDPETHKFELELEVVGATRPLWVGMFARATLELGGDAMVLAIPKEAVFRRFEVTYCFVATESRDGRSAAGERRIEIAPLPGDLTRVAVRSGLAEGETIIVGPLTGLRDGMPVRGAEDGAR